MDKEISTQWSLWWDENQETNKMDVNGECLKGAFRLTLDLNDSCWIEIVSFTAEHTENTSDYEIWQPYIYLPTHEAWLIVKRKNEWDTVRKYFIAYGNSCDMAMTMAIQWAISMGWLSPIELNEATVPEYSILRNATFPVSEI